MTVSYIGDGIYRGLAADVKPTTGVYANAIFIETDTYDVYYFNGSSWIIRSQHVETIENKTINADNNTITNIADDEISSHTSTKISGLPDNATIGTNIILSATGLTSPRTFTLPNATALLAGQNFANSFTETQTVSKTAQAGVSELVQKWTISDNATAYLQIQNASSTDGVFVPRITSYNFAAGAALESMRFVHYIRNTEDTGSVASVIHDTRKSDDTAITSRTLWEFRNAGTAIFKINADGSVVSEGIFIKKNVWQTKPTASTHKGALVYDEDTNSIFRSDGSTWLPIITKMESIRRTGALNGGCLSATNLPTGALAEGTLYGDIPIKAFSGNGGTITYYSYPRNSDGPTGYFSINVSRVDRYPKLRCKTSFTSPSTTRFHCGFTTKTTQMAAATTVPLANTDGGIMFGFDETSNWKIWTCDATGPVTVTDTGIAPTVSINNPDIITIRYDYANTTLYWAIHTFLDVLRGNGTITVAGGAKLPLLAQTLAFHWNFEITDDTTTSHVGLYAVDYEGNK